MSKYFMHRIQKENGVYSKGIEVHDTLDSAVLSFWGRVKTGHNNPNHPGMTFVSCKVTDSNGNVVRPYNMTWMQDYFTAGENKFFFHHIRNDGGSFSKDIDILDSMDSAVVSYATDLEYGYNNPKYPNVSLVSCEITDLLSGGMVLMNETWVKPEETPVTPEE